MARDVLNHKPRSMRGRETDLAMLELFGSPPQRLYDAVHPLAEGREDRVGLPELVPLLVHVVLFSGSYDSRAAAIAESLAR